MSAVEVSVQFVLNSVITIHSVRDYGIDQSAASVAAEVSCGVSCSDMVYGLQRLYRGAPNHLTGSHVGTRRFQH